MKHYKSILEKGIYIAPDADVVGNVEIEEGASIWYHAVVRADTDAVRIGKDSNIQDGVVVHTDLTHPVIIGDRVTVGHNAILHGCVIGDETMVGMGSIVLNGAVIGKNCTIGAGAIVTQNQVIPDGMLAFGSPAKVIRPLSEEEKEFNRYAANEYLELRIEHFGEKEK